MGICAAKGDATQVNRSLPNWTEGRSPDPQGRKVFGQSRKEWCRGPGRFNA